jgi:hypothetical protein
MGRITRNVSRIEQSVLSLEFSAHGKLMRALILPVSPSNPIGDFTQDTRTNRRVASTKGPDARQHHLRPCRHVPGSEHHHEQMPAGKVLLN